MTEQFHHKSDEEASRGVQEIVAQPTDLPLSDLYVRRNARNGNAAYMEGGWAVVGHTRDEQGNPISTKVTKLENGPNGPKRIFKDMSTSELYGTHFAEVERQATERQEALGEGAVEAVLVESRLEEAHVESEDDSVEEVAEQENTPEELEVLARDLNERTAALEASLAASEQERTKLRSDAGRVMQVMRVNIVDQLKRNIAVAPHVITEVKQQLKGLLAQVETDRAASTDELKLASPSAELESAATASIGSRKRELASFAQRIQSNRRNRELAVGSAYYSCGALVEGLLDQLQSGRFNGQLVSTLEVAVNKIEQGIGGSRSSDHELKRLLSEVRGMLEKQTS